MSLELGETDQVGTYEVQIYFAAISVEKIKLEIDDLLEKQVIDEYHKNTIGHSECQGYNI